LFFVPQKVIHPVSRSNFSALNVSSAGDIHIWDRESGALLHHVRAQALAGDLTCIAWNHASDLPFMFATGSHDGAVRIWTSPPQENAVPDRYPRSLTPIRGQSPASDRATRPITPLGNQSPKEARTPQGGLTPLGGHTPAGGRTPEERRMSLPGSPPILGLDNGQTSGPMESPTSLHFDDDAQDSTKLLRPKTSGLLAPLPMGRQRPPTS
jgi:WD40 repeat protein